VVADPVKVPFKFWSGEGLRRRIGDSALATQTAIVGTRRSPPRVSEMILDVAEYQKKP
jgi:hypothetical protein